MIQATKPLDDTHGKDRLLRNSQGAVAHNDGILPVCFLTCKHVPRTYTQRKFNLLDKFKAAIDFEDDNLKYPLVLDTNLVIMLHYLLDLPNRPWTMDHYLIKYIKYKMVYNLDKGNLQNEEMYLTLGRNSRPEAAEFSSFDPTNSWRFRTSPEGTILDNSLFFQCQQGSDGCSPTIHMCCLPTEQHSPAS